MLSSAVHKDNRYGMLCVHLCVLSPGFFPPAVVPLIAHLLGEGHRPVCST